MRCAARWGTTLCALGLVVATAGPVYAQGAEGTQGAPQGQAPANPPPGQEPAKPDGDDEEQGEAGRVPVEQGAVPAPW